MAEQPLRVLVVESDSEFGGRAVESFRETYHYQVDRAADAETAWGYIVQSETPFDVILLDDELRPAADQEPRSCGLELMSQIKAHSSSLPIIMITNGDPERALSGLRAGAFQCVTKAFSPDDLAILIRYAAEQQSAMEHKRADAEQRCAQLQQEIKELENLRRTTLTTTSLFNRETLLTRIIEQALLLLEARSGGLYEYHLERGELTIVAEHGRPDYVGETLKIGEGMAGRLVQSGEPFMIVDNYNEWPGRAHIYDGGRPFGAVLEVPLKWDDIAIAVLYVDDEVGRKFTAKDAKLLGLFAEQTAITLANAQLLIKDNEKLRHLERLSEISSEIVNDLSSMNLDKRLQLIAQRATEILEAEACGICLVKSEDVLSWEASYGHKERSFTKGREFEIKSAPKAGLTGHLAKRGRLFNAWGAKLTGHGAVKRDEKDRATAENCYSLLALPLKKGDQLIGLLRVENKLGRDHQPSRGLHFTQEDEWMLNSFGQAVVVAIEEAKLVGALTQQKDYLERLVGSSPNGIIAVDRDANIIAFNEQAEAVLGYKREEVLGRPVAELYSDPQEPRRIGKLLHENQGKLTNKETSIKNKGGDDIPIKISTTWLFDAGGHRIGSVGYFEDLRATMQKDKNLELLLQASNIIAQAKDLNEGLQRLARMMVSLMTSTFCRILLLDETKQYLIPKAAYPIARTLTEALHWTPKLGEPIALSEYPGLDQHLEEEPKILRVTDEKYRVNLIKLGRNLGFKEKNVQSLLIVPLKIENRVVGLLDVGELREENRASFNEKVALASAIAAQTTVLIDRMWLHETTERRGLLLEALDKASRHIRAVREQPKLMQEIVRLGAELVGCEAGGLYLNRAPLKQLELSVTYGLPTALEGTQLQHSEGLVGLVARTGESKAIYDYGDWAEREAVFEPFKFKTLVAIPLKNIGEVEAVLFVADTLGKKTFEKSDLEILERFAAQAAIALQASLLMSEDQRKASQLAIWHKISDYIQAAGDLDKILQVVLTGITADYGLRFNRAALLLLDEPRELLMGRMGVGQFDEQEARTAWAQDNKQKLDDFAHYLELLEKNGPPPTPVGDWIAGLRLPVDAKARDAFSRALFEKQYIPVKPEEREQLPAEFAERFNPTTPLAIVPLMFRDEAIGLLVVDNRFTGSPITTEDINSLMTFANTAAIAIYNTNLLQRIRISNEKTLTFYNVSHAMTAIQDPIALRQAIVKQTHKAAEATWVSLLLINANGRAQNPIFEGRRTHVDDEQLIRPEGISMQVMRTGVLVAIPDLTKQPPGYVNPVMLRGDTKAAICLPLSLSDKRIGVMWIHYDKPRHFSEFEIAALQLYVNLAASAYDSARRMEKLEKMRKAADALAEADDLTRVLDRIAESGCEVLQADSAVLCFYDEESDKFILEGSVAAGIEGEAWNEFRKVGPRPRGTAHHVMQKEWVTVGDIGDKQQNSVLGINTRKLLEGIGAQGFQGMVLSVGDEKFGVLYANYNRPRVFGDEERETALTFANHAALALKKAKLLSLLARAKTAASAVARVTALEDRKAMPDLIAGETLPHGRVDSAPSARKATLDLIARETMNAVGCDAVVLFEYDKATQNVSQPPAMAGVTYPEELLGVAEDPNYNLVRKIVKRDDPYVVEDIDKNDDFKDRRFARDEGIKSVVALPLRAGRDEMGAMFVNYRRHRRFTRDEMDNMELFANQAAVAIRNAQLFEDRSKKLREQTALVWLSNKLLATVTVADTMNAAVKIATEILHTEFCNIVLLDRLGRLMFVAAEGWPQSLVGNFELPPNRGSQTAYTIETQAAVRVDDYADREARDFDVPPLVFEHHIKSGMSVPMFRGDDVIGAMLVHTREPRHFSDEAESVLSLIANNTAIAIQSAERYQASLRKRAQLNALYEAGKAITASSLDRKSILDQIVRQAVESITGVEGRKASLGSLRRYDVVTNELVTESLYPSDAAKGVIEIGSRQSLDKNQLADGKIGIGGRAVLNQKPQLVEDVSRDPDYFEIASLTKSELDVPLVDKDRVLGVLNVESQQLAGFDQEDQNNLKALADLAVIAIKNARQFQELNQTKGQVGSLTALAWMGMASSTWRHAMDGAAINICSMLEVMFPEVKGWSLRPEERRKMIRWLGHIARQAGQILTKKITPPLSSEEGVERVLVYGLINERLTRLKANETYQGVTFKLTGARNLRVKVSPDWFRRALDLLIDNAVNAMKGAPVRQITLTIRLNSNRVEIALSDTGKGIALELRTQVLNQPISKPPNQKGLGMGLLMVRAIIEAYKGTIRLDERAERETTFIISFPLAE